MRTIHAYTVLVVSALLLIASVAFYADAQDAKKKADVKTDEPILDMFRKSPNAIPLDPRDPSRDLMALSFSVGTAVERNILFSQITGVPWPRPGMATFHFTFSSSLHRSGGLPCRTSPFPAGPRHCGQLRLY